VAALLDLTHAQERHLKIRLLSGVERFTELREFSGTMVSY